MERVIIVGRVAEFGRTPSHLLGKNSEKKKKKKKSFERKPTPFFILYKLGDSEKRVVLNCGRFRSPNNKHLILFPFFFFFFLCTLEYLFFSFQ